MPELEQLHSWLNTQLAGLPRKGELAKAIRHTPWRREALVRCCDDGAIEIDNNLAERALRKVALGRKNWLFAGSDDGGEFAVALYSLLGTAELNDLNVETNLRLPCSTCRTTRRTASTNSCRSLKSANLHRPDAYNAPKRMSIVPFSRK